MECLKIESSNFVHGLTREVLACDDDKLPQVSVPVWLTSRDVLIFGK